MWGNSVTYDGTKGRLIGTFVVLLSLLMAVTLTVGGSSLWGLLFAAVAVYELLKLLFQQDYSISFSSSQGDSDRH